MRSINIVIRGPVDQPTYICVGMKYIGIINDRFMARINAGKSGGTDG